MDRNEKNIFQRRFESKVTKQDGGCHLFTGCKVKGYGQLSLHNKKIAAHRASYGIYVGEIPPKALVLHKCDNPACVNPEHLFLGDHAANARDAVSKKRLYEQKKTHCPYGHLLIEGNLVLSKLRIGWRSCLLCQRIGRKRRYARTKAKIA